MLKLFNTLGKQLQPFHITKDHVVNIFTCGPSVYQRAHIGNFRTFLFEDILVRYLGFKGFQVKRGMNFTDIEDKAIQEALKTHKDVGTLTEENIHIFLKEMDLLRMKIPDYLPKASESVEVVVDIIEKLLDTGKAYRYQGNVYFDPLKYPKFGELYGIDMRRWPSKRVRYHKDIYPGMRWNLGDFILWHHNQNGKGPYWNTRIGKGRPAWNIQDPSMILRYFDHTLSIYCGGIDNLIRHHDYTRAILESIRPYPMARFWLHGHHLYINGVKMSKSRENLYYIQTLLNKGFDIGEIRFFLIYGHYRKKLNYSDDRMVQTVKKLKDLRERVNSLVSVIDQSGDTNQAVYEKMRHLFITGMDDDLHVDMAVNQLNRFLSEFDSKHVDKRIASGIVKALQDIDGVLQVIF